MAIKRYDNEEAEPRNGNGRDSQKMLDFAACFFQHQNWTGTEIGAKVGIRGGGYTPKGPLVALLKVLDEFNGQELRVNGKLVKVTFTVEAVQPPAQLVKTESVPTNEVGDLLTEEAKTPEVPTNVEEVPAVPNGAAEVEEMIGKMAEAGLVPAQPEAEVKPETTSSVRPPRNRNVSLVPTEKLN